MINIIASVGKNGELGINGDLIWHIKDDLIFFRNMTLNHDIIMGRKTFESLPKLLDRRNHIVLTRGKMDNDNIEVCNNIKALVTRYQNKDAFVIGGASIYREFIDYCENIYLTEIGDICENADTFFPEFDKSDYFKVILKRGYDRKLDVRYNHALYKRRH